MERTRAWTRVASPRHVSAVDGARSRGFQLRGPAQEADVEALSAFAGGLPDELVELLSESDGVYDAHGIPTIWPARQIVKEDESIRSNPDFAALYRSFDQIMFFGAAVSWDHEHDSRVFFAPSLERYLATRP